jgi:UDP-2-acetamido-2-deoxy-ribo-hexuluronate aminotransferase
MQFVDLAAQQNLIRDKIETNIQAVLSHGKYIMGPEIKDCLLLRHRCPLVGAHGL